MSYVAIIKNNHELQLFVDKLKIFSGTILTLEYDKVREEYVCMYKCRCELHD